MSERLREDFSLRNSDRERLNFEFAVAAMGIKIYSYVETHDTRLEVLSTIDTSGESLVDVSLCIVDSRSAKLGSADVPVEEEDPIELNCTHTGAPRFTKEPGLRGLLIDELQRFVQSFSVEERAAYDTLNTSILKDLKVDVHQFYQTGVKGDLASTKILSSQPSLREFLDDGPTKCLARRLDKTGAKERTMVNGSSKPSIKIRHPSEPDQPIIKLDRAASDGPKAENDKDARRASVPSLSPSAKPVEVPETIHTKRPSISIYSRRPSLTVEPADLLPRRPMNGPLSEIAETDADVPVSPGQDLAYLHNEKSQRPQRSYTFQLPSQASNLFKWIHVPWNMTSWVPVWQGVKYKTPDGVPTPRSAVNDVQLVIYLPYLHWDSYKHMQERAALIKRRHEHIRARPVDNTIANGKSMENKLIWQNLTSNLPLHCRRTLDQFGYPSLRNTDVRDADQVLYKRTKNSKDSAPPPRESAMKHLKHIGRGVGRQASVTGAHEDVVAKVLMVDQLWLWVLDGETVVTFAAPKEKEDNDGGAWKQADVIGNIYQDINGDFARQCSDPFDFAALAVYHAIKALLDHANDRELQVFRIFEEYISILTERQTISFKEFRNNHRFKDPKSIDAKRLPRYVDNSADLDALLELRDIEDELNTLDKLFKEQQRGVSDMLSHYVELNNVSGKAIFGTQWLMEINHTLEGYKDQVEGMLKSAQTAQKAFKELLDMKQKQANIVEAHLAREQTEVAADQSRSIMIFTIFTIIFLPLSFFASVFGINAREWSGVTQNLRLHTILTYMGSISIAVIIVALLVAFNKLTRRLAQKVWKSAAGPIYEWYQKVFWGSHNAAVAGDGMTEWGNYGADLEKAVAEDAARDKMRLSTRSRTFTAINWDEEMGAGCK
ncbi:MAG: hypothetical protein Q9195_006963 [Heterodermia aff. obscurata]